MPSREVVDPICFSRDEDQFVALKELLGALAGPFLKKAAGRPEKYDEAALYHNLAGAYMRDTGGKAASDSSTDFMAMCDDIKIAFELDDWNQSFGPVGSLREQRQTACRIMRRIMASWTTARCELSDILDIVGQPVAGAESSNCPRDEPALRDHDESLSV